MLRDQKESTDDCSYNEGEPLLSAAKIEDLKPEWRWTHTLTVLLVRIMVDFIFKNPLIFYQNYAIGLDLTNSEFSIILLFTNIGCIASSFIGVLNDKFFKTSYKTIMIFYLNIAAIASVLFIMPSYFSSSSLVIIIWCSVCRFIVGLSFTFISTASIEFVSINVVNASELSKRIAILHYSWALSTLLNIPCGYIIHLVSWQWVFVFAAIILFVSAICTQLIFMSMGSTNVLNNTRQNCDDVVVDYVNGLYTIFTHKNSLLILFTSLVNNIRAISKYIVTGSLWMEDTFNLTEAEVGWTSLTLVFAETAAILLLTAVIHKTKLGIIAFASLAHQFLSGAFLLILALIYGNYIISLTMALIVIFNLTMSHQSFYVVQQSNAMQYAPSKQLCFLLLLCERMFQEIGAIIAILITSFIWDTYYNDAIAIFSVIWTACALIASMVLLIYKSEPLNYGNENIT